MESFTVKSAARLSGISAHTLRAWERRYSAILPKRSPTGRRFYSADDIDRLRLLGKMVEGGHAISKVAGLPTDELRKSLSSATPQPLPTTAEPAIRVEAAPQATPADVENSLERMLQALSGFRFDLLSDELTRARFDFSPRTFVFEFVVELLKRVGEKVYQGAFSAAQEHAMSSMLRDHLGQIFQSLDPHRPHHPQGGRIALAAPEGSIHEFGIYMSAVLCANQGFHTQYIGPNMPANDLARAIQAMGSSILIIGAPLSATSMREPLPKYVERVCRSLPADVEVWIGGPADLTEMQVPAARRIRMLPTLEALDQVLIERRGE